MMLGRKYITLQKMGVDTFVSSLVAEIDELRAELELARRPVELFLEERDKRAGCRYCGQPENHSDNCPIRQAEKLMEHYADRQEVDERDKRIPL